MDDHTYGFIVRLYFFLIDGVLSSGDDHAPHPQPTSAGATNGRHDIEQVRHSIRALLFHSNHRTSIDAENHATANNNSKVGVRLLRGEHVMTFHHKHFMDAIDFFELRGNDRTESYVQIHSVGSFLHHRANLALCAVSCALGLAMTSLWRAQQPNPGPSQVGDGNRVITHQNDQIQLTLEQFQVLTRFTHASPRIPMIQIKTATTHKFISVRGHIIKARPKRLRVTVSDFQCCKCGDQFPHSFRDGRYTAPLKCLGSRNQCRSKQFVLLRSTARYIDFQELKLQETQDESTVDAGRTPRQLEVEVTKDLVGVCNAGDIVQIAGIVRAINTAIAAGKTGKRALETSTYKLYLVANSITTSSGNYGDDATASTMNKSKKEDTTASNSSISNNPINSRNTTVAFDREQLHQIQQIAHADHRIGTMRMRLAFPFDLLVRSLCPAIIGHDLVKAGLLLALLGGTPPVTSGLEALSGNTIRSNSHVLVVGDPGMGKSQMLLAVSQISSRSIYVGGNTATTTGLTVSLTKEAGGEVGIEAGALVLADQGVCCIDEFDKMAKSNQDGLLEAMEQQQISIAKAGIVASLPARCSIVAAANPKHGNYNMGKTVAENLNMSTPILSRFDLVFILRDRADIDEDKRISHNIMGLYKNEHACLPGDSGGTNGIHSSLQYSGNKVPEGIAERLDWVQGFQKDALPANVLRDYIAYAREYCKPKLTTDAAKVLKDYFMRLRYSPNRNDNVPITTRQLEALIRLSQARAKACLRDYVLKEDAQDVIELMSQSVNEVHTDEHGQLDKTRGGAGGKSKRKEKQAFLEELRRFSEQENRSEFSMDDMRVVAEVVHCNLQGFKSMIEELRESGDLGRNPDGSYKFII